MKYRVVDTPHGYQVQSRDGDSWECCVFHKGFSWTGEIPAFFSTKEKAWEVLERLLPEKTVEEREY